MRKMFLPFIVTIALFMCCRFFLYNPETAVRKFFSSYGFELSGELKEQASVTLPNSLSGVYESYNRLQAYAGLDLTPYLGKTVKRYTYTVVNFPFETSSPVRANALVYLGRVIAADIMTVSSDGFMLSPADPVFYT